MSTNKNNRARFARPNGSVFVFLIAVLAIWQQLVVRFFDGQLSPKRMTFLSACDKNIGPFINGTYSILLIGDTLEQRLSQIKGYGRGLGAIRGD